MVGAREAPPRPEPQSLEEVIRARIVALFRPAPSSSASSRRGRGSSSSGGVSTEYILARFRDVGDHYAPLFRQVLRSVAAVGKDKKWHLKADR